MINSYLRPAQWKSAPGEFLKVNFLGTRCRFLLRLSYAYDESKRINDGMISSSSTSDDDITTRNEAQLSAMMHEQALMTFINLIKG